MDIMGYKSVEKVEMANYKLKDTSYVWFNLWNKQSEIDAGPLN